MSEHKIAVSLAVFVLVLVSSVQGWSQQETETEDEYIHYETKLTIEPTRPDVVLRLVEARARRRTVHQLEVYSESSQNVLCRVPVQQEFVARHYEHRAEVARLSPNHYIVLFETHIPDPAAAPPDPTRHQLALHMRPISSRTRWSCQLAARGEHTRLDGGPMLRIDREEEPPVLLRSDATEATRFCGLRESEGHGREAYDPAESRFMARARVDVLTDDVKPRVAQLPPEPFQPPFLSGIYSWAWGTSDYRGTPSGAVAVRPLALGDLDLTTAWVEGGSDLGRREYATASLNDNVYLMGFRIFPGHGASSTHYEAHARPSRILVSLADESRFVIDLEEVGFEELREKGGFFISFPEPVRTNCMSVMILDSRPGKRSVQNGERNVHRAAAISEITPVSTFYADTPEQTARNIVEAIARERSYQRRERLYQLTGLLGDHLVNAVHERIREGTGEERARVIPLLGRIEAELAMPLLIAAYRGVEVDAPEYRVLKRALATHGRIAAEHLLVVLDELDPQEKKYIDTIRLIGRLGEPEQIGALAGGLGEGDQFVRNERIRALAHGGLAVMDGVIAIARANPDTDAAYDALKTINTIGRRLYLDSGEQTEGREGLLTILEQSRLRRHIIRAIHALGFFFRPEAVELLGQRYLHDSPDPLVRRAAARALGYYPDLQARRALERALEDRSPDVRIAAINALASREDRGQTIHRVLEYASAEGWPQALHYAYSILAEFELPETTQFFEETIDREIDTTISILAIRALKRFERSLDPAFIDGLLQRERTTFQARRQLIDLLGYDQTAEGEEILLRIIRARGMYEKMDTPERAETLERHAMLAVGLRRSQVGQEVLLKILFEDDSLERREHALRALAFYLEQELLDTLEAFQSRAPDELQARLNEAIVMIQNRLAIEDAQVEIQEAIEALEERENEAEEEKEE
ncbi:MAG: HEAT repeat domain-containing protein [Bradymonadaceae bacterium]